MNNNGEHPNRARIMTPERNTNLVTQPGAYNEPFPYTEGSGDTIP